MSETDLGELRFARPGPRVVGVAIGALALVIGGLAILLLFDPPAGNRSPVGTALGFLLAAGLLGALAGRTLRSGLWFYAHGCEVRGILRTRRFTYRTMTSLTSEDLVTQYRGHASHRVIIRFEAFGASHRIDLSGKPTLTLDEVRDPDADAILALMRSGRPN